MTEFKGKSKSNSYYIQDSRTYCGNDVLWWRPDGQGYTANLSEAGVYSKAKAAGYRETDKAWPVEVIKSIAFLVVDMQRLPR